MNEPKPPDFKGKYIIKEMLINWLEERYKFLGILEKNVAPIHQFEAKIRKNEIKEILNIIKNEKRKS